MNTNGEALADAGLTVPIPSEVIETIVALVKVFPPIVTGVMPHVLPLVLLRVRAGALAHPQETVKLLPIVTHPDAFLTVMK